MKIGLIAPSPVPFQVGGAEKLLWGLQRYINRETRHTCELIKLPSPEQDFWSLIDSYEAFSVLDVAHFDVVISGKYPAWMSAHPNHAVYMLHRLRGLYDAYHLFRLPPTPVADDPLITEFLAWLELLERRHVRAKETLAECFDRLRSIRAREHGEELSRFPGPFARRVIRFLDDCALSPDRIRRFAAISRTVRDREHYFPAGVPVHVIHPPSDLEGLGPGSDDYFFTVSRLDGPKRVALIVDSMRHVEADVPLLIAGVGPEESRLKEIAAGDPRIRFLGFVSDDEVAAYYRDALAVPYVPSDEDYGLVTLEAMMCSKPVVTVNDAGGPTELVRDLETGLIVPSDPQSVGRALNTLCSDRVRARSMGREGRRLATGIDWQTVLTGLVPNSGGTRTGKRLPKLTVVTTFPVYPPLGGGQSRVYQLYRHLASRWSIEIVSFTNADDPPMDLEIAPRVREIRVPKSREHARAEHELSAACGWLPVTDVAMPRLHSLTPAFAVALRDSVTSSDAIVACHPYLIDLIQSIGDGRPLWYEAQDVEIDLKEQAFPQTPIAADLLEDVARVEGRCWTEAVVAFACAQRDLDRLRSRYGETRAALYVVANGVSAANIEFVGAAARKALKRRLGVQTCEIALFMGSWHPPNLRAVERIVEISRHRKKTMFLVLGGSGMAFGAQDVPENVAMVGNVDEATKNVLLSIADVALNPMETGSGTNLKMLDYFAAGAPVVSTPFGTRGIECRDGEHLRIAELNAFPQSIESLLGMTSDELQPMLERARSLVEQDYDWCEIARRFQKEVGDGALGTRRPHPPAYADASRLA